MFSFTAVIEELRHHELVLFGLGKEGLSSYRFIRQYLPDASIVLVDDQPLEKLDPAWSTALATDTTARFEQAARISSFSNNALIIKTPGVPLAHPLLTVIKNQELPITSNLNLFFSALDELRSLGCDITTIGITGTKGKSTTTALIHHVLQQTGHQVWLGGNIGVAPLELLREINAIDQNKPLFVVLELSSHQLDDLAKSPNIAVIQNIVPEHLDHYGSFERYVQAKSHITHFQMQKDMVIVNPAFAIPAEIAALSPGTKVGFITESHSIANVDIPIVAHQQQASIWYEDEIIMNTDELQVLGEHNIENVMPAVIIAKKMGVASGEVAHALASFKPLPHRLQLVAEINGVTYVNDSLSTVPEATIAAVSAFKTSPIILIAGGYDRGQDFDELAAFILKSNVKALILFPPTGERLAESIMMLGGATPAIFPITDMTQAVTQAKEIAESGDVVLLSPASASFGTFKDYQDRGNQFTAAIQSAT